MIRAVSYMQIKPPVFNPGFNRPTTEKSWQGTSDLWGSAALYIVLRINITPIDSSYNLLSTGPEVLKLHLQETILSAHKRYEIVIFN